MSDNETNQPAAEEKYVDPVIEYYKARVDREEIRRNLTLTVEQRIEKLMRKLREMEESG